MQDSHVTIEMFGGLRVLVEDRESVVFGPQKSGTLLAWLALHLKTAHTREELVALLWPESEEEEARRNLRQCLFTLRRLLEPSPYDKDRVLLATRATIQLNPDIVRTDVAAFETALREASASPEARRNALLRAVDLYRGDLLPGFYLDELIVERNRLAEAYHSALYTLALEYEQSGEREKAAEFARKAVAQNPYMEEAYCTLMRLSAAAGQPSAVLRQYQELERILQEGLGEKPSEATRRLMETLRENGAQHIAIPSSHSVTPPPPIVASPLPTDEDSAAPAHERRNRRLRSIVALAIVAMIMLLWFMLIRRFSPPPVEARKSRSSPDTPPLWIYRYPPITGEKDSEPTAMAQDKAGNLYVTGFVETAHHSADFLTLKLDSNGKPLWRKTFNGPRNDVDRARAIFWDEGGYVYVAGESENGHGINQPGLSGTDFVVIKYDWEGNRSPTWPDEGDGVGVRRYNGPDNGEDRPVSVIADEVGSVYVLGKSWSRGTTGVGGFDYALVKYDRYGKKVWVYRYDGGHGDDEPAMMARDRENNIYITGSSRSEYRSGPEFDFLTTQVNKDGLQGWKRRYGGGNHTDDVARYIRLDAGRVFVIGEGRGLPGTPDADRIGCQVVCYDLEGNLQSVHGTTTEKDRIEHTYGKLIACDGNGAILAGTGTNAAGKAVWRTVMRDAGGLARWTKDGAPNRGMESMPTAISSSTRYGIYVFGVDSILPRHMDSHLVLANYGFNGELLWDRRYTRVGGPEKAVAVLTDEEFGDPIITGQSSGSKTRDLVVLKYQR